MALKNILQNFTESQKKRLIKEGMPFYVRQLYTVKMSVLSKSRYAIL